MLQECVLSCKLSRKTHVSDIRPDLVAITNVQNIPIECGSENRNYSVNVDVGAVLVHLKCGCTVTINEGLKLYPPFPCLKEVVKLEVVVHLIPAQFSSNTGIRLKDCVLDENVSEIVDWNWRQKLPVIEINPPKKMDEDLSLFDFDMTASVSDPGPLLLIWCVALTLAVVLLFYVQFCGSSGQMTAFKKVGAFLLVTLLNPAGASTIETPEDKKTVTSAIWSILKMMELGNVLLVVLICAISFVLLIFFWRIYRFVRCAYSKLGR